jgi:hypothetical protein
MLFKLAFLPGTLFSLIAVGYTADCSHFEKTYGGDTCEFLASSWGLTRDEFVSLVCDSKFSYQFRISVLISIESVRQERLFRFQSW